MSTPFAFFAGLRLRPGARTRRRGITLIETLVSIGILVTSSIGGVYGFMLLNQYASSERNISSAKALCQERIEEALMMPFRPPTQVPTITTSTSPNPALLSGTAAPPYYLLGTTSNYNSSGQYTGSNNLATSSETVQVYVQQDGTTSTVPGTRTTTISLASLNDSNHTSVSLNVVQFTVTVAYLYRNKNYSYSMYTLRGPD